MVEEFKDNITFSSEISAPFSLPEKVEEELDALQRLSEEEDNENENDTQKLKRLFLTFKKKYQQALRELAKKEQITDSSELFQKYQEAQEEIASLILQQQQLKERFFQLKKETQKTVSPPLMGSISEVELQELSLKPETNFSSGFANPILEEENQKLRKELASALSKLDSAACAVEELQTPIPSTSKNFAVGSSTSVHKKLQQTLQEKEKQLLEALRTHSGLESSKTQLEEHIERLYEENRQLEKEIVESREGLACGFKERELLRQSFQHLTREKADLLDQYKQLQRSLHEINKELNHKEEALQAALLQTDCLKREKEDLNQVYEKEALAKKEQEGIITSLSDQIQAVKKELFKAQQQIKEKEDALLEAKQHLAKKVKESSLLNEAVEEKSRQIGRLHEDFMQSKAKVVEMQGALEAQTVQTQKVQELLTACEEKYFRTHERLQEIEAHNRELKKIEEKHEHLQQLLSNLGNMLGKPVGLTQPMGPTGLAVPELSSQEAMKKKPRPKSSTPFSQGDLFDSPSFSQYKKDLFE